jgi:hypothetical protein
MGSPIIPYGGNKDSNKIPVPATSDQSPDTEQNQKRSWINYTDITYVGGHPAYPTSANTRIYIYNDRIEIGRREENPIFQIPYSNISNIQNMDEKKISALRVVGLGLVFVPLAIVGAVWKKRHIYTVIQYNDEIGEQTIVLDFGRFIDKIQPFIYRKMLEHRTAR